MRARTSASSLTLPTHRRHSTLCCPLCAATRRTYTPCWVAAARRTAARARRWQRSHTRCPTSSS
eukprot:196171-Chlamydomonas_euryale.AAC.1